MTRFFFFRCYHCGEWYYSNKVIKSKKCWKCNMTFQFKNSIKISRNCSTKEAILIIKQLKGKRAIESFSTNLIRVKSNIKSKIE